MSKILAFAKMHEVDRQYYLVSEVIGNQGLNRQPLWEQSTLTLLSVSCY